MAIWKKIKDLFKKEINNGSSPEKLALSFSMGLFIAWSPFPGAHTIMMLITRWIFKLNFPILFISTSINNPWTMAFFFPFGYFFGYWFVHTFLGWNPAWTISLAKIFGSGKICLWSFFIGGNLIGVVSALVFYPLMYVIFKKISERNKGRSSVC